MLCVSNLFYSNAEAVAFDSMQDVLLLSDRITLSNHCTSANVCLVLDFCCILNKPGYVALVGIGKLSSEIIFVVQLLPFQMMIKKQNTLFSSF